MTRPPILPLYSERDTHRLTTHIFLYHITPYAAGQKVPDCALAGHAGTRNMIRRAKLCLMSIYMKQIIQPRQIKVGYLDVATSREYE